jgi:lysozyme
MSGLHGIDIASYQGQPGSWTPHAGDIDFAAVKLTELSAAGPYVDPDAVADWEWLGAHGKLRIAYLFAHPSVPAGESVALFEATLGGLGLLDDDMVMLDLEVTDGRGSAQVSTWAADVLRLLERDLGRRPLLYTFIGFAQAGNCAGLGAWPLWIADPSAAPGQPRVPHPWAHWAIHQYSISGGLDRDITACASRDEMTAAFAKAKPDPPPPPPPPAEDKDMIFPLPTNAKAVFAPWADAAGKPGTPYKNASLVLAGETGAQVTVTIWRGAEKFPKAHDLKSGVAVDGGPAHGWGGVTMVTLARTDGDLGATASGVLTRW